MQLSLVRKHKAPVVVVASVLLALFGCELIFRVLYPNEKEKQTPRLFVHGNKAWKWCEPRGVFTRMFYRPDGAMEFSLYNPFLQYAHQYPSNWRNYFNERNQIIYQLNNNGFRGPNFQPSDSARIPGRKQILLLGDSFTFGEGVWLKDLYATRLADKLRNRYPGSQTQVVNLSAPGLNLRIIWRLWNMYKKAFSPDLVVVGFNPNDVVLSRKGEQDSKAIAGQYLSTFDELEGVEKVLARSGLYLAAKRAFQGKLVEKGIMEIAVEDFFEGSAGPSNAQLTRDYLGWLHKSSKEKDAQFLVVILPYLSKLDGKYPFHVIHNLIKEIGRLEGFPVIDVLPAFEGKKSSQFWVHPIDHHPNEVAHELITQTILDNPVFRDLLNGFY